jgi:hypothetical protein
MWIFMKCEFPDWINLIENMDGPWVCCKSLMDVPKNVINFF